MILQLRRLVPAIIAAVVSRGGYVTKTKLTKLLYLLDVEYYRAFRRTCTGLDWKFLHLGPWTAEIDCLLDGLLRDRTVTLKSTNKDGGLLVSDASPDIDVFFSSLKEATPLRTVLNLWAAAPTNEILDYVYFQTEPIRLGAQGTKLDFSTIPEEITPKYSRTGSGVAKAEIKKRRSLFSKKWKHLNDEAMVFFTPPAYDDEFFQALSHLNHPER